MNYIIPDSHRGDNKKIGRDTCQHRRSNILVLAIILESNGKYTLTRIHSCYVRPQLTRVTCSMYNTHVIRITHQRCVAEQ